MWVHTLDPILFSLGPLEIRWYGLAYVLGFLFIMYWVMKYRREINLKKDEVYDFSFYVMLSVIIGSRLFHVLFWEPSYYFSNPLKIFYIWEGGLAFHGGLVGCIFATYWFCRRRNINFFKVADLLSVPAVFALALGRLANFVNAEIFGPVTTVSWCVDFGDSLCRHPYQLYAAVKRFFVFGILFSLHRRGGFRSGFLFWMMITLLGVGRFFLDFLREDTLYWFLSVGQWMSLVMVLVGFFVLLQKYKKDLRKLFK